VPAEAFPFVRIRDSGTLRKTYEISAILSMVGTRVARERSCDCVRVANLTPAVGHPSPPGGEGIRWR